jgi:hypothetical protein
MLPLVILGDINEKKFLSIQGSAIGVSTILTRMRVFAATGTRVNISSNASRFLSWRMVLAHVFHQCIIRNKTFAA